LLSSETCPTIIGRGSPLLRGGVCGLMTTLGGLGHALSYLIGDFWTATAIAAAFVAAELGAIAWIRNRYMDTPLVAAFQVVGGGPRRLRDRDCDRELLSGMEPSLSRFGRVQHGDFRYRHNRVISSPWCMGPLAPSERTFSILVSSSQKGQYRSFVHAVGSNRAGPEAVGLL
jgi:hypothetical protein